MWQELAQNENRTDGMQGPTEEARWGEGKEQASFLGFTGTVLRPVHRFPQGGG